MRNGMHQAILTFWFQQCQPWQWFRRSGSFDECVRERFADLVELALAGDLKDWEAEPSSGLALVLLLDQFSRQIWRGQARAFAGDQRALQLSRRSLGRGWIAAEPHQAKRQFWLMPMLHSEDPAMVSQAIHLLELHADRATANVARRNLEQLQRFGRYPRRNVALKRANTASERDFLLPANQA